MVLVPFTSSIIPPCERALEELERQGYPVRRVGGYAAIDQGRNQMSTDALLDGYEETMWIDANVNFHPDAIDRLRSHRLPIVCGVYPQKGKRALACHVMPGSPKMVFGKDGGLVDPVCGYRLPGAFVGRRDGGTLEGDAVPTGRRSLDRASKTHVTAQKSPPEHWPSQWHACGGYWEPSRLFTNARN